MTVSAYTSATVDAPQVLVFDERYPNETEHYAGSFFGYNFTFHLSDNDTYFVEVDVFNPNQDVIWNSTYKINNHTAGTFFVTSQLNETHWNLLYADVPGIYKLSLAARGPFELATSQNNLFREARDLPFFFEVLPISQKSEKESAAIDRTMNAQMLDFAKYGFVVSLLALILSLLELLNNDKIGLSRAFKLTLLAMTLGLLIGVLIYALLIVPWVQTNLTIILTIIGMSLSYIFPIFTALLLFFITRKYLSWQAELNDFRKICQKILNDVLLYNNILTNLFDSTIDQKFQDKIVCAREQMRVLYSELTAGFASVNKLKINQISRFIFQKKIPSLSEVEEIASSLLYLSNINYIRRNGDDRENDCLKRQNMTSKIIDFGNKYS